MNNYCVALNIKDDILVNCFRNSSFKIYSDISAIKGIELKFGYILTIKFISSSYITINFKSLITNCDFNLSFNT